MLALQIVSATALASIAFLSWRGYVRQSRDLRRLREKAKLGEKIERRLDMLIRDQDALAIDYIRNGEVDKVARQIIKEEDKEIKEMIEKYEGM